MWAHRPVRSLVDMQRRAALEQMGARAKTLHDEGYAVDADRVLDEMAARMRRWEAEEAA